MNNKEENKRVTTAAEKEVKQEIVAPEIMEKFFEMLDPNLSLCVKRKLEKFVTKSVETLGVCVFYKVDKKCNHLITKEFIDLGDREFIITPSILKYSENYTIKPELVLRVPFESKWQNLFPNNNVNDFKKIVDIAPEFIPFSIWEFYSLFQW